VVTGDRREIAVEDAGRCEAGRRHDGRRLPERAGLHGRGLARYMRVPPFPRGDSSSGSSPKGDRYQQLF
jgi:hypothetical protein